MSRSACIVAAGTFGDSFCLLKNRDRNYLPEITIIHEVKDGVEVAYMKDASTGWVEGINEHGIGVVNAALMVSRDESERDEVERTGKKLKDGDRILHALTQKTVEAAAKSVRTYKDGLKGHTIVSNGKKTLYVEMPDSNDLEYDELPADKLFVRTNHGVEFPDAGYVSGENEKSSKGRQEEAEEVLAKVTSPDDIAPALLRARDDRWEPTEMVRDNKSPRRMRTTTQMVLNLTEKKLILYVLPGRVEWKGVVDKMPKDREAKITIDVREYTDLTDDTEAETKVVKKAGVWYSGSPKKFDQFRTDVRHTFGQGPSMVPVFITQDKSFAKGYAQGPEGTIYTVRPKVRKTFDGDDMVKSSRYWPPPREDMTREGQELYDDLESNRIFSNAIRDDDDYHNVFGDSQGLLANILRMDYDVLETTEFKKWLKQKGYDSFYVTGDGPKNMAVFDAGDLEILSAEPAHGRKTAGLLPILDPAYNIREVFKQLVLLEDHLFHPRKQCQDCIWKHLLTSEALAEEAVTLDLERAHTDILDGLAERIRGLARAVQDEEPFDEVAQKAREIRKGLLGVASSVRVASMFLCGNTLPSPGQMCGGCGIITTCYAPNQTAPKKSVQGANAASTTQAQPHAPWMGATPPMKLAAIATDITPAGEAGYLGLPQNLYVGHKHSVSTINVGASPRYAASAHRIMGWHAETATLKSVDMTVDVMPRIAGSTTTRKGTVSGTTTSGDEQGTRMAGCGTSKVRDSLRKKGTGSSWLTSGESSSTDLSWNRCLGDRSSRKSGCTTSTGSDLTTDLRISNYGPSHTRLGNESRTSLSGPEKSLPNMEPCSPSVESYFAEGDAVTFGRFQNKPGKIVRLWKDERGVPMVEIEPVPKGRKNNRFFGLYRIRHMDMSKRVASRWAGTVLPFPTRAAPVRPKHTVTIGGRKYALSADGGPLGDQLESLADEGGARLVEMPTFMKPEPYRFLWAYDTDDDTVAMWRVTDGNEKEWGPADSFMSKIVQLDRKGELNRVTAAEMSKLNRAMQQKEREQARSMQKWLAENASEYQKLVDQVAWDVFNKDIKPGIDRRLGEAKGGVVPIGFKEDEHKYRSREEQLRSHILTEELSAFTTEAIEDEVRRRGVDPDAKGHDIQAAYWALNDVMQAVWEKYARYKLASDLLVDALKDVSDILREAVRRADDDWDSYGEWAETQVGPLINAVHRVDEAWTGKSSQVGARHAQYVQKVLEGGAWTVHMADGGYSRLTLHGPGEDGPVLTFDVGAASQTTLPKWNRLVAQGLATRGGHIKIGATFGPRQDVNEMALDFLTDLGIDAEVRRGVLTIDRTSMVNFSPRLDENRAYEAVLSGLRGEFPDYRIYWGGRTDDWMGVEFHPMDGRGKTAEGKYKEKKKVPKADGKGTTTVYVYSEKQIEHRHREKAKRYEGLAKKIDKLRSQVTKDLKAGL